VSDHPYRGKRIFDLVVLVIAAAPAVALGLCCALAVAFTSRGPVFFRHQRIGMNGRPIIVWKFRTMLDGDNPVFPDAQRITGVGRVLRRASLDELPQLINVAAGEMSIVGPRPTLAYQVDRYDEFQRRRLAVRPGLTGLAQVSGRNRLSWPERIEYDIAYVDSQSLMTDLRIILRTFGALVSSDGAAGHPTDDPLAEEPPCTTS
jgi:lipopolysaccharide/colanic/teichoic acid biosynthesis glycosyltransferase